MFTGIIERTATVRSVSEMELWLDVPFAGELHIGQSVACNGVCLTVVKTDETGFCVEVMGETRERTGLAQLQPGQGVNVERAMPASGRFDGHIVQGHVDGLSEVTLVEQQKSDDGGLDSVRLRLRLPKVLLPYVVEKGSVCLDGVSLTIVAVEGDEIEVGIIPHTWEVTNFFQKQVGDGIHVEVDVLAKYVERILSYSSHGHDQPS